MTEGERVRERHIQRDIEKDRETDGRRGLIRPKMMPKSRASGQRTAGDQEALEDPEADQTSFPDPFFAPSSAPPHHTNSDRGP